MKREKGENGMRKNITIICIIVMAIFWPSLHISANNTCFPLCSYDEIAERKELNLNLSYNTVNAVYLAYFEEDVEDNVSDPIINLGISYGLLDWMTLSLMPIYLSYSTDTGKKFALGTGLGIIFRYSRNLYSIMRGYLIYTEDKFMGGYSGEGINLGWLIINSNQVKLVTELYLGLLIAGEFSFSIDLDYSPIDFLSFNTFYKYSSIYVAVLENYVPPRDQIYGFNISISKLFDKYSFSAGMLFYNRNEGYYSNEEKIFLSIQRSFR